MLGVANPHLQAQRDRNSADKHVRKTRAREDKRNAAKIDSRHKNELLLQPLHQLVRELSVLRDC